MSDTNQKRDMAAAQGERGVIHFESEGFDGEPSKQYDAILEADYSFICVSSDLSIVDEYRKHAVTGVRWL